MTCRLEGKVALVTGAARGNGEAIARRFVAEGASVVLLDVKADLGRAVADDLGPNARFVDADITSAPAWSAAVGEAKDAFGPVDVLVNNAAVLLLKQLMDTTEEDFDRIYRINVLGSFLGMQAVIPSMKEAGGGSIVNISSIDGLYASPLTAAYAASKFAVRGLTKVAALELGSSHIRVNAICHAAGNPEMVTEALPAPIRAAMERAGGVGDGHGSRRPPAVGRFSTIDDVAHTAVFLASDESGYYTGADFTLDGGITAGMHLPALTL